MYTGNLGASETKTYHLKLWLNYDATVEVAANKVYQSKINVIANPEIQVVDNLEATFELNDKTLTSTLTNNVTSATYCTTTDNICEPNTTASIENNSYTVELESNENNKMVCTKLNGTSKIICSNPLDVAIPTASETILANKTLATRTDFSTTLTEDTTGTIYYEDTSKGTTYYFAGNPTDNWVKFANKYWRIIRINEDGSLRLIYQGTSANTTGTGTQITVDGSNTSAFNTSYNNNAYVGFKYTLNDVHGTGTNSTILGKLNTWYQDNLSSYASSIDGNAGFCNDRIPYSGTGLGTSATDYAAYNRLINNKQPTFECPDGDLYTTKGSEDGNKALTYPIGLITADEVAYAGGVNGQTNESYYLYTNSNYWTMSPFGADSDGWAYVFAVWWDGNLDFWNVNDAVRGVRPVINLRADIQLTGTGSQDNPFAVVGAN